MFSTIRNDKYMPTLGIHRIRDEICENRTYFHEVYLTYLRTVNDGEQTFADDQIQNGRFALKRMCFRRDRVVHRRNTGTRIAPRQSYQPRSVRASNKPLRSSVLSDLTNLTRQTLSKTRRFLEFDHAHCVQEYKTT